MSTTLTKQDLLDLSDKAEKVEEQQLEDAVGQATSAVLGVVLGVANDDSSVRRRTQTLMEIAANPMTIFQQPAQQAPQIEQPARQTSVSRSGDEDSDLSDKLARSEQVNRKLNEQHSTSAKSIQDLVGAIQKVTGVSLTADPDTGEVTSDVGKILGDWGKEQKEAGRKAADGIDPNKIKAELNNAHAALQHLTTSPLSNEVKGVDKVIEPLDAIYATLPKEDKSTSS